MIKVSWLATCDAGFDGASLGRDIFLTRSIKISSLAASDVAFDEDPLDRDILVCGMDAGVGVVGWKKTNIQEGSGKAFYISCNGLF